MPSGQSQSTLALFLTREALAIVSGLDRAPSWAEVAEHVRTLSDVTSVPTSTVIQATTVVRAYREVLAAWQKADPGRIQRLTDGLRQWSGLADATGSLALSGPRVLLPTTQSSPSCSMW